MARSPRTARSPARSARLLRAQLLPARILPAPAAGLRAALLRFYDRERRDLPWRRTRDPWAILVSEVMLQQTTVVAVIPYYERFLRRWPTPSALGRARREELLAEWSGLGYYRRAENLQRAAQRVAESGDALPPTRDALHELPGIGDYTAAAVASIAFNEPVAAVDGNVERVLSRLCGFDGDPRSASGRATLRQAAAELLDPARPGDFNQALMELGATVCRPAAPRCETCPLAAACRARASGRPEGFPAPRRRPETIAVLHAAALVRRGARVLMRRRSAAPNAGFLELPGLDGAAASAPARLRERLAADLLRRHGLRVRWAQALPALRHTITHHRIQVLPWHGTLVAGRVREPLVWTDPAAPDQPLTTVARRILARAADGRAAGDEDGDGRAPHARRARA